MKWLEGKVALIAGTARGHGLAMARRFAAEGALVVGGDLPHEGAVETQRLIAREGGTALTPGPLDVTDEASVRSWVTEAVDAFGGIDIVCWADTDGRPHEDSGSPIPDGLDAVWLTVRAAWPHLVAGRGCWLTVGPPTSQLIALTRQLASEGAPYGVRANSVSPAGTSDGLMSTAVFLASDEASDVTGAHVVADSGWSTPRPLHHPHLEGRIPT
ncbi:SDR family NAD(P)-dependent oxidoreductase [Streptomyces sp. NPDC003635]